MLCTCVGVSYRLRGDKYGSDKASGHDYHNIYGPILKKRDAITGILEIGMGTNNTDVVSNIGPWGDLLP